MSVLDRLLSVFNLRRTVPEAPGPRTVQVPIIRAGMHVDHDRALTYSAVFACVRIISESIAMLPWRVYLQEGDQRKPFPNSVTETTLDRTPNPEMTSFTFRSTLLSHALTWGNGYAEIERDSIGRARNLWLLSPDMVEPRRAEDGLFYYRVTSRRGEQRDFLPRDIFHLSGLGFDGLIGYSVVSLMARSIGLGLAAEEFGASLFGNGAMPNSILMHPGSLSEDARNNLKDSISKNYTGASNAFRSMVLEEGMEWKSIGIPPEDAQFLETRKFQVQDIARWFRVPPHKLADLERATFSNIEHQSREFVVDTLMPWMTRLEEEADRKLLGAPGMYSKINANALMRGDSQARADFYQKMANLGVFSVNDIRELEDLNPIGPEGDKRLVQLNQTTLEKIGEEEAAPIEPQPAPAEEDDDDVQDQQ